MQASSVAPPAGSGDLGRLERTLAGLAKRVLSRGVPALDGTGHRLDRTGYFALTHLEAHGPVRASDLAALLELDLSTVSRQVRLLDNAGLLERTADPSDGRAHLLELSPAGRAALVQARRERHAVLDRALQPWDPVDRNRLLDLVERLAGDVDRTTTCAPPAPSHPSTPRSTAPQKEVNG